MQTIGPPQPAPIERLGRVPIGRRGNPLSRLQRAAASVAWAKGQRAGERQKFFILAAAASGGCFFARPMRQKKAALVENKEIDPHSAHLRARLMQLRARPAPVALFACATCGSLAIEERGRRSGGRRADCGRRRHLQMVIARARATLLQPAEGTNWKTRIECAGKKGKPALRAPTKFLGRCRRRWGGNRSAGRAANRAAGDSIKPRPRSRDGQQLVFSPPAGRPGEAAALISIAPLRGRPKSKWKSKPRNRRRSWRQGSGTNRGDILPPGRLLLALAPADWPANRRSCPTGRQAGRQTTASNESLCSRSLLR